MDIQTYQSIINALADSHLFSLYYIYLSPVTMADI